MRPAGLPLNEPMPPPTAGTACHGPADKETSEKMKTEFITCIQCGQEFEFSAQEQQQFDRRGFDAPKRCPACRRKKSKLNDAATLDRNRRKKHLRNKYENEHFFHAPSFHD